MALLFHIFCFSCFIYRYIDIDRSDKNRTKGVFILKLNVSIKNPGSVLVPFQSSANSVFLNLPTDAYRLDVLCRFGHTLRIPGQNIH